MDVAAEFNHDQVISRYRRRVGELVALGHLAAVQLDLRRTVHGDRQRSGTRLRGVHDEFGRLICRHTPPVG